MKLLFRIVNIVGVVLLAPIFLVVAVFANKAYSNKIVSLVELLESKLGRNKFLVIIYSNDKRWKKYIESDVLGKIKDNAYVINLDETFFNNDEVATEIVTTFLNVQITNGKIIDGKEYCPAVIILDYEKKAFDVLRLYKAFVKYNAGNAYQLDKAIEVLLSNI